VKNGKSECRNPRSECFTASARNRSASGRTTAGFFALWLRKTSNGKSLGMAVGAGGIEAARRICQQARRDAQRMLAGSSVMRVRQTLGANLRRERQGGTLE